MSGFLVSGCWLFGGWWLMVGGASNRFLTHLGFFVFGGVMLVSG
jgi:hypothetical protein